MASDQEFQDARDEYQNVMKHVDAGWGAAIAALNVADTVEVASPSLAEQYIARAQVHAMISVHDTLESIREMNR